ncbi:uncharacterized protein A1O9_03555 [Exophiala aquamarina CBS 119918]|uniref:Extracellular membrane protein CFEM domain-containing protein n=1 Tax=Exophiala aquamarina CBS 119918 TaxID=1182545 RepID=A0A072PRM2_9EURO|nr:uncharacterized protein A1O9_03555 [Exophiala aquamarina CBS 119918]KEF61983.1 hypothetical protein A1O9_03555 [Exophiala aquamarina CBS 119918]
MSARATRTTFLPILALALVQHISAVTVTLTNLPAYQSQRSCATQCFYVGFASGGGPDRLADALDCAVDPIENDCFCRADLQDDADAFIQSCVYEYCSRNTIDVSSAVSIYDSYCTAAGFNRAVETTATQGNSGTASSKTNGPLQTNPPPPASTSSTSSSSSNKSTPFLSTSELVGIIVGVCGFIATSIGVWFSYRMLKNKRAVSVHGSPSYIARAPSQHVPMGPVAYKHPFESQNIYHGYR